MLAHAASYEKSPKVLHKHALNLCMLNVIIALYYHL